MEASIDLTYRCNLRCKFCNRWKEAGEEMSTREILSLLDELSALGFAGVGFSGGEPLLRGDLPDILIHAREVFLGTTVATNGTLITQKFCDLLSERDAWPDAFYISIDSHIPPIHDKGRGKGNWKRAINGLNLLLKNNPRITGVSGIVTRDTFTHLVEYVEYFKNLGVERIGFQPVHGNPLNFFSSEGFELSKTQIDQLKLELNRLFERYGEISTPYYKMIPHFFLKDTSLSKYDCFAGRCFIAVSPDGSVFPCDARRDLVLGNVREKKLTEILSSRTTEEIVEKLRYKRNCQCLQSCIWHFAFKNQLRGLLGYLNKNYIKHKIASLSGGNFLCRRLKLGRRRGNT